MSPNADRAPAALIACPSWCTNANCNGDHAGDFIEVPGTHDSERYGPFTVTISPARCDFGNSAPAVTVMVTEWNQAGEEPQSQAEAWLTVDEAQQLARELSAVVDKLKGVAR